jgi:hypothetical protein
LERLRFSRLLLKDDMRVGAAASPHISRRAGWLDEVVMPTLKGRLMLPWIGDHDLPFIVIRKEICITTALGHES